MSSERAMSLFRRSGLASPIGSYYGALIAADLRAHPLRALVAILAIAAGVAMGYAVHLINRAALTELSSSINSLMGDADVQIRGPRAGFDESLYPRIARLADVAAASPVVEIDAPIAGREAPLKLLGIDAFRAGFVTPNLVGRVAGAELGPFGLLAPDAVFLSPAAMTWLGVKPGDEFVVQAGLQSVALRVVGALQAVTPATRVAVMDIGAAQWRLHRLGTLQRIDIRLRPGVDVEAFRKAISPSLPPGVEIVTPRDNEDRTSMLSRAYRANLNVLALVALFTGVFLVLTMQTLAVLRRRTQFALLRALGLTRRGLLSLILAESTVLGVLGAALGLAIGFTLAAAVLRYAGGDLGAGYFEGVAPLVHFDALSASIFFALGVGASILGSIAPASEAAHAPPAAALKAGDEETAVRRLRTRSTMALSCGALIGGLLLTQLPPVAGLPVFGYLAIALMILGGVLAIPAVSHAILAALPRPSHAVSELVLAQLAHAPGRAAIGLAGIVVSFSLMTSMAVMVSSFRIAFDEWLHHVLPASLYIRSASAGDSGYLSQSDQAAIAATPGIERVEFLRATQIALNASLPAVSLLARPIDPSNPGARLPLVDGPLMTRAGDPPPIWISEAVADLYGMHTGQRVTLPIAAQRLDFIVAGVWRDYVRQFGAIVIEANDYRRLTGDTRVTDAALWLAPGESPASVIARMRTRVTGGDRLTFAEPGEIRAMSLKMFDRSFAVTYLLETVAVLIGLIGIGANFGAQALARRREFGVLRHFGVLRRQIGIMLALEGALVALLGVSFGLLLGLGLAGVLVHVINPQSFHWTMNIHIPWLLLAALACLVVGAAALTARVSARAAMSVDAVRAVRDDW
jgi:putative ABC transport system permease protein